MDMGSDKKEYYVVQELYQENVFVAHNICPSHMHRMPALHFHDGYEIFLSLCDGCVYVVEEEIYSLNRGGLIMVNDRELHRTYAPSQGIYERCIVSFVPDFISNLGMEEELFEGFLNRPAGKPRCICLTEEQIQELLQVIGLLQRYIEEQRPGGEMLRKLALSQVVVLCNGYLKGEAGSAQQMIVSRRLQPAFAYIREHIGEIIRLDDLAEHLFLSKAQLIRLFKAETGMTPNEYITLFRIMKSREYLTEGNSLLKVCELVGYADESHFIRTFKKIMGITPKQYGKLRRH